MSFISTSFNLLHQIEIYTKKSIAIKITKSFYCGSIEGAKSDNSFTVKVTNDVMKKIDLGQIEDFQITMTNMQVIM